jgi:beta-glucanase (GH16 family)
MRRVVLVITVLLIIACLSLYIMDYRLSADKWIGQQEDAPGGVQPGLYPEPLAPVTRTPLTEPSKQTIAAMEPQTAEPDTHTASEAYETMGGYKNPDGWVLVWEDEFDKPALNMECWTKVDRRNNFNGELQYYAPSNVYVKDGMLYLEARDEKKDGKRYTSGMVQTADKLDFHFGRFEARVSLPVGKGLFPAYWLIAYEDGCEIDILEMIGSEPNLIYGVNHYMRGKTLCKNVGQTIVEDPEAFHVYAAEWDRESILWFVDGTLFHSTKRGVPDEKMFLILTLAVGGVWPGAPNKHTVFPSRMAVDYVRYYRPAAVMEG